VRITVRVPATSANLGPGFDCFGLALDLCNEVTLDTEGPPGIRWEGEGAGELPIDGTDAVTRAIRETVDEVGTPLPPFSLVGSSRIPLERGLGSSAAAAVAGAALGLALGGVEAADEPYRSFDVAARLEGHPDNAAAASFGGVTIVVDGIPRRLDPHPDLRPVILVPELRTSTLESRRMLPDPVGRRDAVAQIGYVAALTVALTQDPRLLPIAMRDRLHEDVRLEAAPAARALRDRLRDAGLAVCLSGAGPSLLAFEREGLTVPDPGEGWTILRPGIRRTGVDVAIET
jgi:homoserine kinase